MPSTRPAREPKYLTIAADVGARIRSGEYRPGEPLPSQRTLSAAYGVTVMTLRQALQVLADEGLVVVRQGKDSIVTPPHASYHLDTLRSLTDDLREQGYDVTTEVVGAAIRKPPAWVAAEIGEEPALRLERLRFLGRRPAVFQVSWVRQPYAGAVRHSDFRVEQLYAVVTAAGVVIHRAVERIRPGVATARVAGLLRRPQGSLLLVSDRITYALDGAAVIVDRACILSALMEIRAERSSARVSIHWGQPDGG